jgi:predicted PurR-regulated permease PerM
MPGVPQQDKSKSVSMLNNKWTKRFINITLILLIVFLYTKVDDSIMPVIKMMGMLISPIIIGTFIYYALRPIVKFLGDKFGHRGVFAFLTIILFLTIFKW